MRARPSTYRDPVPLAWMLAVRLLSLHGCQTASRPAPLRVARMVACPAHAPHTRRCNRRLRRQHYTKAGDALDRRQAQVMQQKMDELHEKIEVLAVGHEYHLTKLGAIDASGVDDMSAPDSPAAYYPGLRMKVTTVRLYR